MALQQIGYVQYAFASPIKRALNSMFGWKMEFWDNREWKESVIPELGFSPRRAAQTLGTQWGRGLKPTLWLDLCAEALRFYDGAHEAGEKYKRENPGVELVPQYVGMVVSDVRFENEATFIRENGGEIWHIVRDHVQPVEAHESERGIIPCGCDIVLFNRGTLPGLQKAAQMIARGE
jgi:hypothetical protein